MYDYVVDIEDNFPLTIVDGSLCDNFNIEFRVGFSFDPDEVILMSVMLIEGGSYLPDVEGLFDLRFGLRRRCINHVWKVEPMEFQQSSVERYIPRDERQRVCSLLARATSALVKKVRPKHITMSTFDKELPAKALVKYAVIEGALVLCGYTVADRYRSDDQRNRWHFQI